MVQLSSGLRVKMCDRDRQIWCRHSSTKSDGWERNRTGDTEAGGRTFVAHTANEPESITGSPKLALPAGRGIIDTRIVTSSVFTGDQNTWGDWSFKLRSYVLVVISNSAR